MEIFCLLSGVSPAARTSSMSESSSISAISRTRVSTCASATLRFLSGEGQIVVDGHGVVDDRKLEHLRDVAVVRGQGGDVLAVKQHASLGRVQQAGNDVQQRRLAATGWAEQGVGAAILPLQMNAFQGEIGVRFRVRQIAVPQL